MKLSTAKTVLKLLNNKEINGSEFKDKKVLNELCDERIVHINKISTSRSKIKLINEDLLGVFLLTKYNIKNLKDFIEIKQKKDVSREELSSTIGDTKAKSTNVQTGLYINSFESIELKIDDENYILNPISNASLFINHLSKIEIEKDILLVIVENFENLLKIKKQKYLFEPYNKKMIFVFRNSALYNFIKNMKNRYLYFGDIDLAGISIFLKDIKPKTQSKGEFFIPCNLEDLLKKSNSKLYFKQYEKYKRLSSDKSYINELIKTIHAYKKTIEQELFIKHENGIK